MPERESIPLTDASPAEAEILRLIRSLRYGSLEIQVHDARIVQVERRERVRFDRPTSTDGTA